MVNTYSKVSRQDLANQITWGWIALIFVINRKDCFGSDFETSDENGTKHFFFRDTKNLWNRFLAKSVSSSINRASWRLWSFDACECPSILQMRRLLISFYNSQDWIQPGYPSLICCILKDFVLKEQNDVRSICCSSPNIHLLWRDWNSMLHCTGIRAIYDSYDDSHGKTPWVSDKNDLKLSTRTVSAPATTGNRRWMMWGTWWLVRANKGWPARPETRRIHSRPPVHIRHSFWLLVVTRLFAYFVFWEGPQLGDSHRPRSRKVSSTSRKSRIQSRKPASRCSS